MTEHTQGDLLNYGVFLTGQVLFLLKRAGSALRNPNSTITSRRAFFYQNWDTWGIRAAIEFPMFYFWRHVGIGKFILLFGVNVPAWLQIPDNPMTAFFLGYAADSILDWISLSPKLPGFLRSWIGENVPKIGQPVKLQQALDKAADAAGAAKDAAQDAGKAIAQAQDITPKADAKP